MRNFDIIKDIDGLGTIYRYCSAAEDFQVANPMVSAMQARLALETMVKTVYRNQGDVLRYNKNMEQIHLGGCVFHKPAVAQGKGVCIHNNSACPRIRKQGSCLCSL